MNDNQLKTNKYLTNKFSDGTFIYNYNLLHNDAADELH